MTTQIGTLDKYCQIQRRLNAKDAQGGTAPGTWATYSQGTWFSMEAVGGREHMAGGKLNAETTHLFRTWFRADMTPKDRILLTQDGRTRAFEVESVLDPDEGRRELVIQARETVFRPEAMP